MSVSQPTRQFALALAIASTVACGSTGREGPPEQDGGASPDSGVPNTTSLEDTLCVRMTPVLGEPHEFCLEGQEVPRARLVQNGIVSFVTDWMSASYDPFGRCGCEDQQWSDSVQLGLELGISMPEGASLPYTIRTASARCANCLNCSCQHRSDATLLSGTVFRFAPDGIVAHLEGDMLSIPPSDPPRVGDTCFAWCGGDEWQTLRVEVDISLSF